MLNAEKAYSMWSTSRLSDARMHLNIACDLYYTHLLALDAEYAQQEPQWQEGPEGQSNVAVSQALRERIDMLQIMLPGTKELG